VKPVLPDSLLEAKPARTVQRADHPTPGLSARGRSLAQQPFPRLVANKAVLTFRLDHPALDVDWARRQSAWIFEDDYDGAFRFCGRPLAALQSLDSGGHVT
jgi:hypothetical protein